MGTLDAHLVALDGKTGKVMWDKEVADPTYGYSITHAPLIIGDNVIVGVSGGEYGIRGHVTAYNAMTGEQVWRWYSIPAPNGDPDLRRQGAEWLVRHLGAKHGRWRRPAPRRRQGKGRQRQVRRSLEDRRRRRLDDPGVRQGVEHHLRRGRQPVARPRRQRPSGRQPVHRLRRRHRRHDRQDEVVLPDGAARRLGPRRRLAAGGGHGGRAEGRGPCRQDRLGVRARRRHRQAGPPERQLRPAGEHVRAADRKGHADAAGRQRRRRSGRRSRSIRRSTTPSWRRCTSR